MTQYIKHYKQKECSCITIGTHRMLQHHHSGTTYFQAHLEWEIQLPLTQKREKEIQPKHPLFKSISYFIFHFLF